MTLPKISVKLYLAKHLFNELSQPRLYVPINNDCITCEADEKNYFSPKSLKR